MFQYVGNIVSGIDSEDGSDLYASVSVCPDSAPCVLRTLLSRDGGDRWDVLTNAPANGLVLAAPPGTAYAAQAQHLFRTIDRGESWQEIDIPGIDCPITAVAVDPNDPQNLYAGGSLNSISFLCAQAAHSNDGGAHWTKAAFTPRAIASLAARGTHAVAGATSGGLYPPGGVFESFDSGATWTDLHAPDLYVGQVWFGPRGSIYAATGSGLYRLAPAILAPIPIEPPARVIRPPRAPVAGLSVSCPCSPFG
jgi:photosystem II stability/assembly factor-like uncharacterized protein